MISSLLQPLRGIVCVSLAGSAGLCRKPQIVRFPPFACTGFRVWVSRTSARDAEPATDLRDSLPALDLVQGVDAVGCAPELRTHWLHISCGLKLSVAMSL